MCGGILQKFLQDLNDVNLCFLQILKCFRTNDFLEKKKTNDSKP